MGLTVRSVGRAAVDTGLQIKRSGPGETVVALSGNPNVGKSTVFNALTGADQHTGNWPGKTVACAQGRFSTGKRGYILVDIPGCYSLMAHSAEEECARDFLCFGGADAAVVVCDACCLERNLNLVLQTMEITENVIVCVNLLDEAKKRGVSVDLAALSEDLGIPVVGAVARRPKSLAALSAALDALPAKRRKDVSVRYCEEIERAVSMLEPYASIASGGRLDPRWLSLRLLDADDALMERLSSFLGSEALAGEELCAALDAARKYLAGAGIDRDRMCELIVSAIISRAESLCRAAVTEGAAKYAGRDRRLDRVFTSRLTGYPVMLLLLAFILWLTIVGANYPSGLLSRWLLGLQNGLSAALYALGAPPWLQSVLVCGVYRVLAWVVSVMLPPMAIFFPLFTLLEDAGYLPRVAYNLDRPFRRCGACGKQSLTMCMGFGCNAAGIVGCRIIDSPRDRLLAVLTNSFVPCNGRFPALIAMLAMFFSCGGGLWGSLTSAALLTCVILIGVGATFLSTKLLSATVLRGVPSSFTLEMPPYRVPQVGRVIVRSVLDRTLFVLGRAAAAAAPAGLLIWCMANIYSGGESLLRICAGFLDPLARFIGLDGVVLMAFILGFPANEIVIPIIVMAYMADGSLSQLSGLGEMKTLLIANGWTWRTAASFMLFSLMHWPCAATLLTIRHETGSARWTALAFLLPAAAGTAACALFTFVSGLF
jgi:ferrous iron transport protein B